MSKTLSVLSSGFLSISFPTKEENKRLEEFEDTKWQYINQLVVDTDFQELIRTSKVLKGNLCGYAPRRSQVSLSTPRLSTGSKLEIPKHLRDLLGAEGFPALNYYWLGSPSCKAFSIRHPIVWGSTGDKEKIEAEFEIKRIGLKNVRVFLGQIQDQWPNPQSISRKTLAGIASILKPSTSLGPGLETVSLSGLYPLQGFYLVIWEMTKHQSLQLGVLPYFETILKVLQKQGSFRSP